jgi:hypothetical protein
MNTQPTPETDKFFATFADGEATPSHAEYYARLQDLERERNEAREALKTGGMLNIIDRAAHERAAAIRERDEARAESIRWMSIAEGRGRTDDDDQLTAARAENGTWKEIASGRLSKIAEVTAQRDRLAEALEELRNNESLSLGGAAYEIVEQALQSITPKL